MSVCPRALSLAVLCQWQGSDLSLDAILEPQLAELPDSRDRNLAKAIIFGVLRQRGFLDWLLAKLSTTPLPRLRLDILQALRIGAYQLLFCERLPPAAAIHATVEAVKHLGHPRWLIGFVNGVLRNVGRRGGEFLAARSKGQAPPEACLNHPSWLVRRWRARYGEQGLRRICHSNEQAAQICLRVNVGKIAVDDYTDLLNASGIPWRPGRYLPEALWLAEGGSVGDLPGFDAGYFWVQDEVAQVIGALVAPLSMGDCLDACAGLGGKTAILGQSLLPGGSVVAIEPQSRRQRLLAENMRRLGLDNIVLFPGTVAEYGRQRLGGRFAAVLVDAPCSGLGVTGRHPDIRWQRREKDLPMYQVTQLEILREAACLLAPGGVLVYATCSMEPEENEEVVGTFLHGHPEFLLDDAGANLPVAARDLVSPRGFLCSLPGYHGSDGFFAARMRRAQ